MVYGARCASRGAGSIPARAAPSHQKMRVDQEKFIVRNWMMGANVGSNHRQRSTIGRKFLVPILVVMERLVKDTKRIDSVRVSQLLC